MGNSIEISDSSNICKGFKGISIQSIIMMAIFPSTSKTLRLKKIPICSESYWPMIVLSIRTFTVLIFFTGFVV